MYQATHKLISKEDGREWLLDFNYPSMIYLNEKHGWVSSTPPNFNYFEWVLETADYYYIEEFNMVLENE